MTNVKEREYMGTKAVTKTKPQPNFDLKEPMMYKVIYINDEVTSIQFVVESLQKIFGHTFEEATILTETIHAQGSGVAGIFPYEMAEQKGVEVTQLARSAGFPLQIKLEPVDD
jgi:ATP-dependent Clp protease adaptor protein ClpS